jgi:hypothetical protein
MLNATRRNSFVRAEPLCPGETYELDIPIDCTGWVFAKGHRIRLSIASADWPNVWPTPEPASNQIVRSPQHPSRLILPLVPAQGSTAPPTFHPSPRTATRRAEAVPSPTWQVTCDQLTGRTTVQLAHQTSWRVNDTTVIERAYSGTFDVAPARPADASAKAQHRYRMLRPNQATEGRADVAVQATATHFHLTIEVEVRVNGALHFTRRWAESVARQGL